MVDAPAMLFDLAPRRGAFRRKTCARTTCAGSAGRCHTAHVRRDAGRDDRIGSNSQDLSGGPTQCRLSRFRPTNSPNPFAGIRKCPPRWGGAISLHRDLQMPSNGCLSASSSSRFLTSLKAVIGLPNSVQHSVRPGSMPTSATSTKPLHAKTFVAAVLMPLNGLRQHATYGLGDNVVHRHLQPVLIERGEVETAIVIRGSGLSAASGRDRFSVNASSRSRDWCVLIEA